ncbi:MAG: hypothetical protein IPJ07_08995 [Acidobacteria bacterium]|nr:hypothetical protein [Acidobacteriota bacterium]
MFMFRLPIRAAHLTNDAPDLNGFENRQGEQIWRAGDKTRVQLGTDRCNNAQSAATTGSFRRGIFRPDGWPSARIRDKSNGAVIWDFDTAAKPCDAVNGMRESGSIDAAGPTIVNGMLYINSGYGRFVGQPVQAAGIIN